ncbi:MAG: GNAT family N-acetyltransferase [Nocardioidaceae bacterium]|nr:GNAT family N-acetyltransferase [Nocardioidaceae bacterium]
MVDPASACVVEPVRARDADVQVLLVALTAELAGSGYTPEQTFGYSVEQLEAGRVHLVGARVAGRLVGVAGIEVQVHGLAELKRFFVGPEHRGAGVADALIDALLAHAAGSHVRTVRLETGDEQRAAMGFYRRHGFVRVPRFSPYEASETSVCMERAL